MNEQRYILLADCEGEDSSRFCGVTSSREVAKAWYLGDGHVVYAVPPDGKLLGEGYPAFDMDDEEQPSC